MPVATFLMMNATSVSPSWPGALACPISQMLVSRIPLGSTVAASCMPNNRREAGSPLPAAETMPRAPKPNVESPPKITPPKSAALPITESESSDGFERWEEEEQTRGVERIGRRSGKRRTDVKLVIVAAATVGDSLLRRCLVAHDPVGFAVLGD